MKFIKLLLILTFVVSYGIKSFAVVDATFTVDKSSGCSPITVSFTYSTSGLTYSWTFGDGNTSTLQSPQHIYSTPGNYLVTLTVSGNGTDSKTKTITVFKNPTSDFTVLDPKIGCTPLNIRFQDNSSVGDAVITDWSWDFGNGTILHDKNPNYTFSVAQKYNLIHEVTDANGCSSIKSVSNLIDVADPPTVSFSSNPSSACKIPTTVQFINSSTGAGTLTYDWTVIGVGTSQAKNPSFTFSSFGNYNVKLKVTTAPYGCFRELESTFSDQLVKAVGTFKKNGNNIVQNSTICDGDVSFASQSIGAPLVKWEFGDGTFTYIGSGTHLYDKAGTYKAKLIASPGGSCADTVSWTFTVEKVTANYSMTPDKSCQSPTVVQFTNSSSANAVSFKWDYPDGTSSSLASPSKTFYVPGDKDDYVIHSSNSFLIRLTSTSALGCVGIIEKTIVLKRPTALFSIDSIKGCAPLTVNFTDKSLSDVGITAHRWEFGDGNNLDLAAQTTTLHVYNSVGVFNARLIITNSSNCKDTSYNITIKTGKKPTPSFSVSPTSVCNSEFVTITNLTAPGDNVDFWQYSINGINIASCPGNPNPVFKYKPAIGNLDIKLKAGNNGCYAETTISGAINNKGPIGSFSYDLSCTTPRNYNFTATPQGASSFKWEFGDGNTDNSSLTLMHQYPDSNKNYTVKFISIGSGCSDTVTQILRVRKKQAQFTAPTQSCAGSSVSYNSTGSQPVTDYCHEKFSWNFNDSTPLIKTPQDILMHIFSKRGIYNVVLKSIYDNGCIDSISKSIRIFAPYSGFKADKRFGCPPLAVTFIDTSKADVHALTSWVWDYGDGTPVHVSLKGKDTVYNTYSNPGQYNAKIVVADNIGCKDSSILFIGTAVPDATFSALTSTDVCAGSNVKLYYQSLDADSVFWSFGDSIKSKIKLNPIDHSYADSGQYKVKLTTYKYGCSSTWESPISIRVQKANARFTVSSDPKFIINDSTFSCYPLPITITPIAKYTDFYTSEFDFGNGLPKITFNSPTKSTYYQVGTWQPTLKITTTFGCQATYKKTIKLTGPLGKFDISKRQACKGDLITYTMHDTLNVARYEWDLGDGNVIANTNPVSHRYSRVSKQVVKLILYNASGTCPAQNIDTLLIYQVFAKYSVKDTIVCSQLPIAFADSSLGATSYEWNFGDGQISPVISPIHYFNPGTFPVRLAINGLYGCKDTASKTFIVNPSPSIGVNFDKSRCPEKLAIINATANGDTLYWTPSTGIVNAAANSIIVAPTKSIYYKAITKYKSNGCIKADSVLITRASLNITPRDTSIVLGEQINIITTDTSSIKTFKWMPQDFLVCPTCLTTSTTPIMTGITYNLVLTEPNNCFIDTVSVKISTTPPRPFKVPTAFKPNDKAPASNQIDNRVFMIRARGIQELLEFKIYNRWGNLVFSSNDLSKGWDGKYQGKDQPIDTYIWVATAKFWDGTVQTDKGTILLLR